MQIHIFFILTQRKVDFWWVLLYANEKSENVLQKNSKGENVMCENNINMWII